MSSFVLIGLFLICCHLALASKKDVSSIFLFSSQDSNSCQTTGLQCKDCDTMQYCNSAQESVFEIRCADQSKTNKFCDSSSNSCVKDQPTVCVPEESSFECPSEGMFPDLENCNNYYLCDENKVATNFACSAGFIYNHTTKGCTSATYCKSYSSKIGQCKGKINKLVAYAPSKDLYILCLSGKHSMLFQCPIPGDAFVEDELTCKFECTKNGFFPYHLDSSKFYSCVQIGKKFSVNLLDCPEGTEFVELGDGQGICTIKTTTTTTTEAELTVEGSGEAPEETEDLAEEVVQEDLQGDEDVVANAAAQFEDELATNEDVSNVSPVEAQSVETVEAASVESVETIEK